MNAKTKRKERIMIATARTDELKEAEEKKRKNRSFRCKRIRVYYGRDEGILCVGQMKH